MALYQAIGKTATQLTGYFLPKGGHSVLKGTLHVIGEEKAFVRSIIGGAFVDFGQGELEPIFATQHGTVGAGSRTDWGGGINRLNAKRLGRLGTAVLTGEKRAHVFAGRQDILDNFVNVRDLPAEDKARIDFGLRFLGWE